MMLSTHGVDCLFPSEFRKFSPCRELQLDRQELYALIKQSLLVQAYMQKSFMFADN